ncbi:MAG TPA: cysteine desulfurase family protein [Synergistaceae bacterium]|nr:cysteine desulfurase family protein [Synergistaceae bacterium]HPQ37110.1 cysteine desulfurase family protein [Synergistaceae bacterium]
MSMRKVYLDHSATTPVAAEVLEAMLPYFSQVPGNPNSIHAWGQESSVALQNAREQVASLVGAKPEEIVFTGGGSEADNLAIKGSAFLEKNRGKHLITTAVEHHAVLDTCKWLEKQGFPLTVLPVNSYGQVTSEQVREALREDTFLVSVMHGNNEVGSLNPIQKIGNLCREKGVLFHVDAVQTAGHVPMDLQELPVDLLTLSAHKMYGPKGIGALYVRKKTPLVPLIHGGGQEFGLRSGTENVPSVVGFGAAAALGARRLKDGSVEEERRLRDLLIAQVLERNDEVMLTGHPEERLPYHTSFCIQHIEGEAILLRLDALGIGASSGSACTSGSLEPSYVLLAMGLDHATAHGSLRMTLGKDTSEEDVRYAGDSLKQVITVLRKMSPFGRKG